MRVAIPPIPQYTFIALCLFKDRDKFALPFPYSYFLSRVIPAKVTGVQTQLLNLSFQANLSPHWSTYSFQRVRLWNKAL